MLRFELSAPAESVSSSSACTRPSIFKSFPAVSVMSALSSIAVTRPFRCMSRSVVIEIELAVVATNAPEPVASVWMTPMSLATTMPTAAVPPVTRMSSEPVAWSVPPTSANTPPAS